MPVERGAVTTDGHIQIHWPGAYAHALERKCDRDAMIAAADYLTLADSEITAWHRDNALRKAALVAERNGEPVTVQSEMLPDGMPSPFEHWPRGGNRGSFTITPDDVITLRPRPQVVR
jgi:hypothetical protein